MDHARRVIGLFLVGFVLAACGLSGRPPGPPILLPQSSPQQPTRASTSVPPELATAREKIKHVVIIMQENRSFDTYFGTYPGADGIPLRNGVPAVCVPDPLTKRCDRPFRDTS